MFTEKISKNSCKFCSCKVRDSFMPTRPGLAYSPAKMMELAERGIPVSGQSVGAFFDGVAAPTWEVPLERARGVDIADVWQAQAEARNKLHKAKIEKVQVSKDE